MSSLPVKKRYIHLNCDNNLNTIEENKDLVLKVSNLGKMAA